MRSGSGIGDVEGPRHAGNAYACERIKIRHDLGTLLSTRGVNLENKHISPNPQLIF
jgi:hypothetical protein